MLTQKIERQNECFRNLTVISQCCVWAYRKKQNRYQERLCKNFTANMLQAWKQIITKNTLLAFSLGVFQTIFDKFEQRA